MRTEKVRGVVLKRSNYSEADRLITVFAVGKGKINLLAKGVRRIKSHRAPHLELFNEIEFLTSHGVSLSLLTEVRTVKLLSELKSNLELTGFAFYLSEILDRILPERQAHDELYILFINCLAKLNNSHLTKTEAEKIVKEFVLQMVWNLGYLPEGLSPRVPLTEFIESIVERKVRSKKFLDNL